MLFYSNRKAHPFSISDVPIYKSIFHLLQAPPVTVYKSLFFNVSSTILMGIYCPLSFQRRGKGNHAGKDYPDAGYRSKPTGNVAERSDLTE